MSQLFDDNTMNFIDLWSYIQERDWFENAISPEDMVLINELVSGSNFDVAMDLLRHRLHPFRKKIPEEFSDVLKPAKCIKVRDTSHLDGYVTHGQKSHHPPSRTNTPRSSRPPQETARVTPRKETVTNRNIKAPLAAEGWKVEELPEIYENARRRDPIPVALTDTDVDDLCKEMEKQERKNLREMQDEEYQQSLAADKKRATYSSNIVEASKYTDTNSNYTDAVVGGVFDSSLVSTLDFPTREEKWPDSLFTVFPTNDSSTFPTEVISHDSQDIVVDEPKSDDVGAISVVVVLPSSGERVSRFFLSHHTLENVAMWAKVVHGTPLSCFSTTFPRQSWPLDTRLDMISQGQKRLLIFGEE